MTASEPRNFGLVLYYLVSGGKVHITRTTIAGCKTECGIELRKGQALNTVAPPRALCHRCQESIRRLRNNRPSGT